MSRPAHQPLGLHLTRVSRTVSRAFYQRLRSGLSDAEASQLETLLTRLRDNVSVAFD
jgi:hypothetical protein